MGERLQRGLDSDKGVEKGEDTVLEISFIPFFLFPILDIEVHIWAVVGQSLIHWQVDQKTAFL